MVSLPIQNYVYKKKIVPFLFNAKARQGTRLSLSDSGFINSDSVTVYDSQIDSTNKQYCVLQRNPPKPD